MSRKNTRKDKFLAKLPDKSFTSKTDLTAGKCKFNFSFFDSDQDPAKALNDLTKDQICKFFEKLKNYSSQPLKYWQNQRAGAGGLKLFAIYDDFPKKSEFTHPKHVPHEARWARFRMEGDLRLIGFLIPEDLHDKKCENTKARFDSNTFYIVFIDRDHKFYLVVPEDYITR